MSKATAQEVVNMMAELMAEGDEAFRRMHGEAALDIAREVQAALMAQFESNLGHVVLWEQFLRTPQEVGAAVSVVVAYC
jgi:ABC-type ATPase with predicted acetyltransferase domain